MCLLDYRKDISCVDRREVTQRTCYEDLILRPAYLQQFLLQHHVLLGQLGVGEVINATIVKKVIVGSAGAR